MSTITTKDGSQISAVQPLMLKTAYNFDGLPIGVFDGIRQSSIADLLAFLKT